MKISNLKELYTNLNLPKFYYVGKSTIITHITDENHKIETNSLNILEGRLMSLNYIIL
jgi:hypothetical protein